MGQAKQRGSLQNRIAAAKAKVEALRPKAITCNECLHEITEITDFNTRGMEGIDAAFVGLCPKCGSSTYAIKGLPESAEALMLAINESTGEVPLVGLQNDTSTGRGNRQQRIAQAEKTLNSMEGLHVFINENGTSDLLLSQFPCVSCNTIVIPDLARNQLVDSPVRHALQFGVCATCGASHLIASASTKDDCIKLEPVVKKLKKEIGARMMS